MLKTFLLVGLILIACSFVFYYVKSRTRNKLEIDNIAKLSTNDTLLKSYKHTAQYQLDYLIKFMAEHDKNDTLFRYAVKSNFHEDGENEHMWTQVYEFIDEYFIGTLTNEPSTIKKIKYGDSVKIYREDVEDWLLEDFLTNTQVGGFSRKYMRSKAR